MEREKEREAAVTELSGLTSNKGNEQDGERGVAFKLN